MKNLDKTQTTFQPLPVLKIVRIKVDMSAGLTDSPNPRNYWKVLKHKLLKEGNETVTNCNQLKFKAEDGKMRMTDVADTEQLFRIIQSVSSPKAEPFK